MMWIFRVTFLLISVVLPICASENKSENKVEQIIITAHTHTPPQLVYLSSHKIDKIKQFVPSVKTNEPFFSMGKYETTDQRARFVERINTLTGVKKDSPLSLQESIDTAIRALESNTEVIEISKIFNDFNTHARYLPLKCFIIQRDNQQIFKPSGADLFSFSRMVGDKSFEFVVKLNINLDAGPVEQIVQKFQETANYYPEDGKELLDNGILAKVDEKIIHGPEGYFGKEKIVHNKKIEETTPEPATFFSSLKKPLMGLGILLTSYALWTLYKKYYP